MHNSHSFGSKPGRGSGPVNSKRSAGPDQQQQWQYPAGYDYQSYYAAWQNYQSQNPYYNYDQAYGGYGSGYQYQSPNQFPGYQYPAQSSTAGSQPAPVPEAPPPPLPVTNNVVAADSEQQQASATVPQVSESEKINSKENDVYYTVYDASETIIEEHDIPLDVDNLNRETVQSNDDLYDSLEESRWLPIEMIDYSFIRGK